MIKCALYGHSYAVDQMPNEDFVLLEPLPRQAPSAKICKVVVVLGKYGCSWGIKGCRDGLISCLAEYKD